MNYKMVTIITTLLVLSCPAVGLAADPPYQAAPPTGTYLTSGISDLSGPGGKAYVEYWVWDGANDWYYYTYKIHNTDPNEPFTPYIKHFTVANPTGEPYVVTGCAGGYLFDYNTNQPTDDPGEAWLAASHVSLPTLVDWAAPSLSYIFVGQSSWDEPKFQFASKLPPAMAGITVRQGDLTVYAAGLIASPGLAAMKPRSPGYWKHQFGTKGKRVEAGSLGGYLDTIGANSSVFSNLNAATKSTAAAILDPDNSSDMRAKAKRQLIALWLNVVSGKVNYSAQLTFDDPNNVEITITVEQLIANAEAVILDTAATTEQLEYQKDMAEIINLM